MRLHVYESRCQLQIYQVKQHFHSSLKHSKSIVTMGYTLENLSIKFKYSFINFRDTASHTKTLGGIQYLRKQVDVSK